MGAIRKTETVTFRMEASALKTIQQAAALKGKTMTAFVTEVAQAAAEQALMERTRLTLSDEVFDEIDALLAEPARVNDGLKRLMRRTREWLD